MRTPPQFRPRIELAEDDRLLTTHETAAYLGISRGTLAFWRSRRARRGPPYTKVHARAVRYRWGDLQRFLRDRIVRPQGRGGRSG
jgi:predicted DNA-binding transcriptional regulator AlpA